jgi:septal ring factor EnvC (AmiA/AmiB activator)
VPFIDENPRQIPGPCRAGRHQRPGSGAGDATPQISEASSAGPVLVADRVVGVGCCRRTDRRQSPGGCQKRRHGFAERSRRTAGRPQVAAFADRYAAQGDGRRRRIAPGRGGSVEGCRARDLVHPARLLQLTTQIDKLQATLRDLGTQARELEQQLSAQQAQLGKLLYRQYLRGTPDPLRLFLNGDDPNQLARDLHYLGLIGRARSQILQEIEATLHRKQALATDTRQQAEQLSASEAREKEAHAKLLAQREQRQAMLDKVSDQIATQRREIGNLQRDERRLAELVERLSKIIATRAPKRRKSPRSTTARRDGGAAGGSAAGGPAGRAAGGANRRQRQEKPARAARSLAEKPLVEKAPVATTPVPEARVEIRRRSPGNLARMKGQLRLPTRGSISNRFGTPRQEGSTWKGLFILASAGSEVRSIAGGRVVFAEWMRGFGNLLIVDHGGSYLSIYANNDSLLKQVGDEVRAAEGDRHRRQQRWQSGIRFIL